MLCGTSLATVDNDPFESRLQRTVRRRAIRKFLDDAALDGADRSL